MMFVCDVCEEIGESDCMRCEFGNPCLGCNDYDEKKDTCKSDGGRGKTIRNERQKGQK